MVAIPGWHDRPQHVRLSPGVSGLGAHEQDGTDMGCLTHARCHPCLGPARPALPSHRHANPAQPRVPRQESQSSMACQAVQGHGRADHALAPLAGSLHGPASPRHSATPEAPVAMPRPHAPRSGTVSWHARCGHGRVGHGDVKASMPMVASHGLGSPRMTNTSPMAIPRHARPSTNHAPSLQGMP